MRILVIIGTRPEAIKLAPVIRRLQCHADVAVRVCLTGQHRELLSQGLADFHLHADHNLDLMQDGQSVNDMVARVLAAMSTVLNQERPDWVVVQGDTSSAIAAALAAFHHGVRVAHVEAGLRTGDPNQPWPEEINRRLIAQLAHLHFAPTPSAKHNLEREGIAPSAIEVCGNTVIDALLLAQNLGDENIAPTAADPHQKLILCTLHRRENLTPERLSQVETALKVLVAEHDCHIVFPFHPNPALADTVARLRDFHPRLRMIAPLSYVPFVRLMMQASLILTDSGGIQEEAAYLGKPVLIMRTSTERPEVLEGDAILVGTDEKAIITAVTKILQSPHPIHRPTGTFDTLGTGGAASLIVQRLMAEESAPT
ncbi:non-hydrolyzing UDP-N-acetylglucosamine 2-epimerase [Magnetospirillum gryphiswaldense]|uniref:UDP-N-acetylglucosamine 2-epimerase (non-hydrolyzing) n=1 Tax=Magnetospirillum gryphiswaldense TaxID=55518 RepID=A4TXA0_9PROT|nr:UDP-N-acetylglucosamine 2-epimerase (non-hydrolyzing) [Magnetospirillum gryphiswaldense]CAM75257.1 UDP-N-acetylglucosamine 2-epimerase [Magnetospirillum gryphiswaldense MSR-1]